MTSLISRSQISISPMPGSLGAVVEGLHVAKLSDKDLAEVELE